MHTVQLKMSQEGYDDLKKRAKQLGETSVAAFCRKALGLFILILDAEENGYKLICRNEETGEDQVLVFPKKEGV